MTWGREPREWITPGGCALDWVQQLTNESHVLIGGTTGSGKSILLNYIIYTLLLKSPNGARLLLIDPKGCELVEFADLPHVWKHCDTVRDCVQGLADACALMDSRFKEMKQNHQKQSTAPPVYVLIDEWIDLKTQAGKLAELPALRLIAKGRASNIHIILCTQRPTREIITGAIRANFPAVVALRCNNRQESRNLLDIGGAEALPLYGSALYKSPRSRAPELVQVEQISPEELARVVEHWKRQKPRALWGF